MGISVHRDLVGEPGSGGGGGGGLFTGNFER